MHVLKQHCMRHVFFANRGWKCLVGARKAYIFSLKFVDSKLKPHEARWVPSFLFRRSCLLRFLLTIRRPQTFYWMAQGIMVVCFSLRHFLKRFSYACIYCVVFIYFIIWFGPSAEVLTNRFPSAIDLIAIFCYIIHSYVFSTFDCRVGSHQSHSHLFQPLPSLIRFRFCHAI